MAEAPEGSRGSGSRGLIFLLGLVVAGSSWQFAARSGMAERRAVTFTPIQPSQREPAQATVRPAPVSFKAGLGLDGRGAPARGAAVPNRDVRPLAARSRPSTDLGARRSAASGVAVEPLGRTLQRAPGRPAHAEAVAPLPPFVETAGIHTEAVAQEQEDDSEPVTAVGEAGDDPTGVPDLIDDASGRGSQLLVVGPGTARQGELLTLAIQVENARNVAHSPIRIAFDPDVLQFVSAEEGDFLAHGNAGTRFLAQESGAPGVLEIAISRVPPAHGRAGNGVLCSVTFLAMRPGTSPVFLAGSGLLDPAGRRLAFSRNDADVAVH